MSHDEIISRAATIAAELGWPWDENRLRVRSLRIWPFPRVWKITSHVEDLNAVTWMTIRGDTGRMTGGRVRYLVRG
jgi:hypothetical protein